MSTQIAISAHKAAYIMFEAGLGLNIVQTGIYDIKQPSKGYYYISDVLSFIKENGVA